MKQVLIRLKGEFIEVYKPQVEKIVAMIADAAQVPFDAEESLTIAKRKQWKKIEDTRVGWKGDLLLRCDSVDEVLKLFNKIEGKTIEVGDMGKVSVEVIPHARIAVDARNRAS